MSAENAVGENDLDSAIGRVYDGPLEEFIGRRDALVKQLRSAKRRDDAAAVKALRKPSRPAWALNAAARDGSGALDGLVEAVAATIEAQSSAGDVRGAIAALRGAVRGFTGSAARAAAHAGHRIEESALANAVLAVIGKPGVFDALRAGRLVDVPEAGGLDFLASLPQPALTAAAPLSKPTLVPDDATADGDPAASTDDAAAGARAATAAQRTSEAAAAPADAERAARDAERAAAEAAVRETLRQTELAVAAARDRSAAARRGLVALDTKLETAEERVRRAEQEARTVRDERDRASHEADAAAAQLDEAEEAVADARRELVRLTGGGSGH